MCLTQPAQRGSTITSLGPFFRFHFITARLCMDRTEKEAKRANEEDLLQ